MLLFFKRTTMDKIRLEYEKFGVDDYYKNNALIYSNPHKEIIANNLKEIMPNLNLSKNLRILDLCAGSGEITEFLIKNGFKNIIGSDPYIKDLYIKNTGKECFEFTFKEIATGKLKQEYDVIFCSFALHLAEESMLPQILYNLSLITRKLIIISPHKKPAIKDFFTLSSEFYKNKVRTRLFLSNVYN